MKRYAVCVQFDPTSNHEMLVGRCLKILHGYQCRHKINLIGATFPEIRDGSIGGAIAFVSTENAVLKKLIEQSYFQQMQELDKFCIRDQISVPDDCPETRYIRERTQDKNCEGGRQRAIRRGQRIAEKAGYEYQPRQITERTTRHLQVYHNIPMISSRDAAQVFYLRIQKQEVDDPVYGGFTS